MKTKDFIKVDERRILNFVRTITLLSAIAFLLLFLNASKTNCEACSFTLNDKKIDIENLLDLNEERCINPHQIQLEVLDPLKQIEDNSP